jgi:hypothetical protein
MQKNDGGHIPNQIDFSVKNLVNGMSPVAIWILMNQSRKAAKESVRRSRSSEECKFGIETLGYHVTKWAKWYAPAMSPDLKSVSRFSRKRLEPRRHRSFSRHLSDELKIAANVMSHESKPH